MFSVAHLELIVYYVHVNCKYVYWVINTVSGNINTYILTCCVADDSRICGVNRL